jgi:hypothetical protein
MSIRKEKILRACLCRSPDRAALERFLPENEKQLLDSLPHYETAEFHNPVEIHWSWFAPILKEYSAKEQKLFLQCFDPYDAKRLSEFLKIKPAADELPEMMRNFLRTQLLPDRALPPQYLSPSPLNRILLLGKKELLNLINGLSLYDLSYEFRQILETKNLKKLYSLLSEEQKELLAKITPPADQRPLQRLGLDQWKGTAEELRLLLHRRGLARLGIAICGSDEDFCWTLCHKLDTGRGGSLHKLYSKQPLAETAKTIEQIDELLRLMK